MLASQRPDDAGSMGDPRQVGIALFGPYVLGVELASMLLLVGPHRRLSPRTAGTRRGVEEDGRGTHDTRLDRRRRCCSASGCSGVLVRRNIIFILMSIEVMLNAAGLAFVVAGARWGQADGQIMFLFILAMAAAEVAVGLALVLQLYHRIGTLDADAAVDAARLMCCDLLWLVPAVPFAGFLVLVVSGARLRRDRRRDRRRRARSRSPRRSLS